MNATITNQAERLAARQPTARLNQKETMTTTETRTARSIAHEVLVDLINGHPEIDSAALVADARPILRADSDFVAAFLDQGLTVFLLDTIQEIARDRRQDAMNDDDSRADRRRTLMERLGRVYEPTAGNIRVAVAAMTRPDLLAAANERRRQASGYLRWAGFEEDLAAAMPNDTVTVGEFFTERRITTIWNRHMGTT
jgi:hypothetical protein